jgi:8-oxo-dGTP diphosphatase
MTADEPGVREPVGAFRYCPYCASGLIAAERGGRKRSLCQACGFIEYRNPVVGVAVIVRRGDAVLLGRRSGSYRGQWCIPCGYVEWDEDVQEAARREFEEETGLEVRIGRVYAVHSNVHNPRLHTVGIWFEGEVVGGSVMAGDDLDEVRYFGLNDLPDALAFPTDRLVLEQLRSEAAEHAEGELRSSGLSMNGKENIDG